ncbi:MAG: DUF3800 domain-containing protein [Clostridia bacterium]|nr:DUF3800 domain-containing protein [Clostridia bacterium]
MDIFIYSDESGVFDVCHNRYFVFGGLIFLSKEERDICARKYSKAEKDVKAGIGMATGEEAKASNITNASKGKLFRALNHQIRFGVIIEEDKIHQNIWLSKKDKQRYLDYAYKIAVKRCFENLIRQNRIDPTRVKHVHFFVDEHTTATNGRYELRESLEQEFKWGTFNYSWNVFYPPIFPDVQTVTLDFCNSSKKTLVRAADIVANRIYYYAKSTEGYSADEEDLFVIRLP